jgi:hypothetical protein
MAHTATKLPACANCHYTFPTDRPNEFCPRCGQQNHELSLSAGHVLEETLEGLFHFDGKVFRTAKLLLFKPGELTKRFLEGKRMPYVPPIRLYVFLSFVFFFLLSLSVGTVSKEPTKKLLEKKDVQEVADSVRATAPRSTKFRVYVADSSDSPLASAFNLNFSQAELLYLSKDPSPARLDSAIRSRGAEPTTMRRLMLRQTLRSLNASPDEITNKWIRMLPTVMFVLMPLFALLLKWLYRRQHQYYLAHLIFSIHFHSFVFVLFIVNLLLGYLHFSDWFKPILFFLPAVYFYLALRNNFGQPWLKTLAKVLLMMVAYGMVLGVSMIVSALISVFTL